MKTKSHRSVFYESKVCAGVRQAAVGRGSELLALSSRRGDAYAMSSKIPIHRRLVWLFCWENTEESIFGGWTVEAC